MCAIPINTRPTHNGYHYNIMCLSQDQVLVASQLLRSFDLLALRIFDDGDYILREFSK